MAAVYAEDGKRLLRQKDMLQAARSQTPSVQIAVCF
jgi:hypothetical protein